MIIKLTAGNFTARLKQANLASKNYIANFIKKTDFDNKLLSFNKRITSYKTKHVLVVLVENKLNELSKKVEAISTKGLTKDLTNRYKILNESRHFYLGSLQNHLIHFSKKEYFRFLTNTSKIL